MTCTFRKNEMKNDIFHFKGQIIHIPWALIPLKLMDNLYYLAPVKGKDKSYPF